MSNSRSHILGIVFVIVGSIAYSAKAIFVKLALGYGVDPLTILSMRMLVAAPIFALILYQAYPSSEVRVKINFKDHMMLILTALLGFYMSSMLDFYGLQYITASLERIVLFSYPAMVVVFSALLFKKTITKQKFYALIICYLGLVLAFISELGQNQANLLLGSLLILACAVTFSFYYIGSERLILIFGSRVFTAYAMLVATAATSIHFLFTRPIAGFYQAVDFYLIIFGMAIFSTVVPTIMLSEGIKRIGASSAAIVSIVGPFSTIVLAALILGESMSILQILGGMLVVTGILLLGNQKGHSHTTTEK